jgi:hypothetical protein
VSGKGYGAHVDPDSVNVASSGRSAWSARDAGLLFQLLANEVVGDGPAREADLAELTTAIHVIQRAVMGQAAARAYPGQYRPFGEVIPTFDKDGRPLPPGWAQARPGTHADQKD